MAGFPVYFYGTNAFYTIPAMSPATTTDTIETDTIPEIIIFGMIFCRIISFSSSLSAEALATSLETMNVPGKPKRAVEAMAMQIYQLCLKFFLPG